MQEERTRPATRLRAGLRRHGIIPRPSELRRLLRADDVRFTTGNALELYCDGAGGLDAMLTAIEGATRRVHLETYILRADATGRRFLDALTGRARAGAEVRLLYDAVGSRGLDARALTPLRDAGGDVTAFNPLRRFYPHWAPRRRDHRKLLVVDGRIAFTGGLNIGDEYALGAPAHRAPRVPWRDAHLSVEGPAVRLLDAVFLESWFRADGADSPWLELGETYTGRSGGASVGIVADGPTYHRRRMRDLLVEALEQAEHYALFATPYFVPGGRMRDALMDAAGRGVAVAILLAGESDHPILRWAARGRILPLLESGVQVFECEHAMMHAKVAVLDGALGIVGTSNLDRQSLQHSYEVNLLIEGDGMPEKLAAMLRSDSDVAHALTVEALARRTAFERLRDRWAAWLISLV